MLKLLHYLMMGYIVSSIKASMAVPHSGFVNPTGDGFGQIWQHYFDWRWGRSCDLFMKLLNWMDIHNTRSRQLQDDGKISTK